MPRSGARAMAFAVTETRTRYQLEDVYPISRTVSEDGVNRGRMDDRSARTFAVKPAPSARRYAASGLTARRRPSKSDNRAREERGYALAG